MQSVLDGRGLQAVQRRPLANQVPVQTGVVDACGASPWDSLPDSDASQACIDATCPGDTVVFTSGVGSTGYRGYLIDKTLLITLNSAKSNLTLTFTNAANHALLKATPDLKGFVVRPWARYVPKARSARSGTTCLQARRSPSRTTTSRGAQINYLIEGLDLMGTLVESGNTSGAPRMTEWEAAKVGCSYGGYTDTWGALDRVAHHPSLTGWMDKRMHCER